MTRKIWTLIALAVVFGGVSLYLNQDWFAGDHIQITHRSRAARSARARPNRGDDSKVNPVYFNFGRRLKLTSLKVVPLTDLETNKYPHAIWNLVSESNSVPISECTYGMPIRGLHPTVKGISPEPLEPGVTYRLLIAAGSLKAEHDFVPEPRTQ